MGNEIPVGFIAKIINISYRRIGKYGLMQKLMKDIIQNLLEVEMSEHFERAKVDFTFSFHPFAACLYKKSMYMNIMNGTHDAGFARDVV